MIADARADARLTGVALFGSAAAGREDRWSDIDLAFGVSEQTDLGGVIADWTDRMYWTHAAIDHVDLFRGATVYRVFVLPGALQVDLAFAPAAEFGAVGPSFRLLLGSAGDPPGATAPSASELAGLARLHALHARSSIARGRAWQAEYMIGAVRNRVLALGCLRYGPPASAGRGIERLPPEVKCASAGALVGSLEASELSRALRVVTDALLGEIRHVDARLAERLAGHRATASKGPFRSCR